MSTFFHDLENVRAYIDNLFVLGTGTWEEHLLQLEKVLTRLQKAGLRVNARKSFFGRHGSECLGYWITIYAIQYIALCRFIGMVNYYRDMWICRSETLAPLTALTSKDAKWDWTEVHQLHLTK